MDKEGKEKEILSFTVQLLPGINVDISIIERFFS